MTNYKKYSLGQVENFLYDAMSTDATPQEIYDVIKSVVEDNYYTYKHQTSKAYELLALLNGNGKGHIKDYDDCMRPWGHSDMEALQYTEEEMNAMCDAAKAKDKVKKWVLPVEETKVEETDEIEYFITFPDDLLEAANLKEGDQVEWHDQGDGSYLLKKFERKANTYDDMIAAGYTMTDDGFWIKE
jgi:bifunctional DNA-binding transcriptional regulator/antitoxin component of YhaV-PrlF toxin-antitoxin module